MKRRDALSFDMLRRVLRMRWWWLFGIGCLVAWATIVGPAWGTPWFRRAMWTHPMALVGALMPLLFGIAWLVVLCPLWESQVSWFADRRPAARRARFCRVFAWVPTVIFTLLMVQVTLVKTLGIQDFGWFGSRYIGALFGAIALSLFYASFMSRHLVHRVRTAAAKAGVCFSCNYDVSYLAGDRCPECGYLFR